MKWTKKEIIKSYKVLAKRLGTRPTSIQFYSDSSTPCNVPIRDRFGSWKHFENAMGIQNRKSHFAELARINASLSRMGRRSHAWKGGRLIDADGYVLLYKPNHPNTTIRGYIKEHRFVMAEHLGRPLTKTENVHHKDGNKQNNKLSNLELWSTSQPAGQRVKDKIKWAKSILKLYKNIIK